MIKEWTLSNFKSVSKKTTLNFEPLTIFAGANSSGKSTILQSILLTTQTIQSPISSRSVILNGHISKFGNFKDLSSHGRKKKEIEIGFKLEPTTEQEFEDETTFRFFYFDNEIKNVELSYKFLAGIEQLEQLNPTLESVEIKSSDTENKRTKISIKKSKKTNEEKIQDYKIKSFAPSEKKSLDYDINISPIKSLGQYYLYKIPNEGKIIGTNLVHFIPNSITFIDNELENQIDYLRAFLEGKNNRFESEDLHFTEEIFTTEFKNLINSVLEDFVSETRFSEIATKKIISDFRSRVSTLKNNFNSENLFKCLKYKFTQRYLSTAFNDRKDELDSLFSTIDTSGYISANSVPLHLPELGYIENQFKKKLKYLGPLRDEPKSIYPLEGYIDTLNIGFKGENTAAVLELHKNKEIKYVPSREFSSSSIEKEIKTASLQAAVLDWLIYLGVATQLETRDMGKLGHELMVSIDTGQELQDLTHVGVGVSQILPILVLSFLAGTDSTLIFEQPELHLHPKVQTRLADFFISQNILKKQCIVETHSEYLINRLRYLIARSEGDSLSKDAILYFVEKEGADSIYKEIRINKYGVIPEWPKGFFDESEKLSSQLLEAGLKKRSKEK
ncbi:DUF3696 domain-containing protein [Sphingobacterium sp. DN00404]|uniref:DUF3696 domain-containing protein n=1 Tax=Sphingobacterium micropteri TaxID=2763501 RepID=A0ABR7YSQ2_9SPHI|nr:DUF3696 domain-containing protein [Sphingobacterium micropteri]MBD1434358.1 DUF3696 domain-containing protein [Sphingobacterium micropteri]